MKGKNSLVSKFVALPIVMGALVAVSGVRQAEAATSSTTTVTLRMDNYASVTSTASVMLTPTQADFDNDNVTSAGAITVTATTNDSTGCTVSVAGAASPTLLNADVMIKSSTAGTKAGFASYAAVSTTATALWGNTAAAPTGTALTVDVKVQNLKAYAGGALGSGSTADYTNTLTFTIVPNA